MSKVKQYITVLSLMLFPVSCTGQEISESHTKDNNKQQVNAYEEEQNLRNSAIFYATIAKHVRDNYVENTNYNQLLEGALNGMLSSLDPHSAYLTAKQYEELRSATVGEFGGLGVEVTMVDGLIKIISPMEDTPAFKAGLMPGDMIIRIGEEPVYGMSMVQAVDKLKGKPGTEVVFTVRRNNSNDFEVKVTRAIIHVDPVKLKIQDNIGIVRITTFNEDTTQSLVKAIKKVKKDLGDKLDGVVLDLRNNAGGLFDQAVSVANLFIDSGRIVTIKSRDGDGVNQHVDANPNDLLDGTPIAVLINAGSASASEIVAGALQDQKRAIIVGTKSFGKGSVQTVIPLSNGGALKLTTSLYYTPNDRSIQKLGIEPDIVVEQAMDLTLLDEKTRVRESNLNNAVANGNHKQAPQEPTPSTAAPEKAPVDKKVEEPVDYQLIRAMDILKGIHFYKNAGHDKLQ